jgi:Ca-activated chloride channel family protein
MNMLEYSHNGCANPPAGETLPQTLRQVKYQCRADDAGQVRALLMISIILMLLSLLCVSATQAQEPVAGTASQDNWGLEFRGSGQQFRSLALDTEIEAEITGLVARIDIRQRFRNTGQSWAEAIYRFPLPAGAAVDRLLVHAGQRVLQGEIQERQSARRQYQLARAEGMVAALVEQQRPNQFETRLANIGPDEEITVAISFLAQVDYRDATFSLQLPLTFTPRWDPAGGSHSRPPAPAPAIQAMDALDDHHLTLNIRLRSGLSIASLASRYHDMDILPAPGGYNLFLTDPDTRTDRVFELDWKPEFGRVPESALMTWDGGDAVYALLMLAPPLAAAVAPQPREVVFVIDTSGSMEGLSLQQAKAALHQGLGRLEPDDRFNLVQFDSDSQLLFEQSLPADEVNLVEAMDFIDALVANGGTNMAPALHDAMSLPAHAGLLRQIVFVTDGSVGNEEDLLLQIADELADSRLFTVAIGSAPNIGFMRKAAAIGRGNHTHIGRLDEVTERMGALWARIENPAVQDICVDWGMDAEFFPEIIPDLYAGEPLWLYARLPAEPRAVTLCGKLDGQPWEQTSRLMPGLGNENLAALWARSKIEALQDSRIFGLDEELIRQQVTALAVEFGLLTAYTSLIAVDHTPVRPAGAALTGNEIANLLPAGSSATAVGFSATASGWLTQLLLALLTLLAATSLLWFCTPSRRTQAGGSPLPPKPDRTDLSVLQHTG